LPQQRPILGLQRLLEAPQGSLGLGYALLQVIDWRGLLRSLDLRQHVTPLFLQPGQRGLRSGQDLFRYFKQAFSARSDLLFQMVRTLL
jgi:hypothetical protein